MAGPVVIRPAGPSLVAERIDELRKLLLAPVENGSFRIVLDLSDAEFVDSRFLGLLMMVLKRAREANGDVRLATVTPSVLGILKMMALDRVLAIHPTVDDACASFADG